MMLLKKKKDIMKAMEKELEGASDSTISWLADAFDVPLPSEPKLLKQKPLDYSSRISELIKELKTKTLSEAERERNLVSFGYTGVGYGYNLKTYYPKNLKKAKEDTEAPGLNRLMKLIASIEAEEQKAGLGKGV
jgi:hypothetical protein